MSRKAIPAKRATAGASEGPGSRERLLQAATIEFARQGLRGARVDVIARRARINKQLIYYHFGDKDALYLAVLEHAYADIRTKERALQLSGEDPSGAMAKLVGFTFDYVAGNRAFVRLLINENLLEARFVRRSRLIRQTRSPLEHLLRATVQRGAAAGLFRRGVDPAQLYITIAGLCFFYIGNIHTLSVLFERDLQAKAALRARRSHVIDVVLGYLAAPARKPERRPATRARAERAAGRLSPPRLPA